MAFIIGRTPGKPEQDLTQMQRKLDREIGRDPYRRRLGSIAPVVGNLRHTTRLHRCTLRGRRQVNPQWQLCCLVHHSETIQRDGRIARAAKGRGQKSA